MIMKHNIFYLLAIVAMLTFTACNNEDSVSAPVDGPLVVEFNISSEGDDIVTRAADNEFPLIENEPFETPQHLYSFVVLDNGSSKKIFYKLIEGAWEKAANKYLKTVQFVLDENSLNGFVPTSARAYFVASAQRPKFTIDGLEPTNLFQSNLTEDKIKDMIVDGSEDADGAAFNVRDIYSTPYNLQKNGAYYVTATSVSSNNVVFGSANDPVVLYHVAAKVDFVWNTAKGVNDFYLTKGITAFNIPSQGYVFRPTENVKDKTYDSYTPTKVLTAEDVVTNSSKNKGRAYAYVLQPDNHKVEYDIYTNKVILSAIATPDLNANSSIYASWFKIKFTLGLGQ